MPWRTATILLVDDEQPILDVMSDFLGDVSDVTVLTALNGEMALSVLQANSEINLLITDMLMPVMGGSELVKRARVMRPDLRVLMISGSWSLFQVPEDGGFILAKPFTLQSLLNAIKDVMNDLPPDQAGVVRVGPALPEPSTRS